MSSLSITFVLGTRPEILKLASVIAEAQRLGMTTTIVHTGQHYDHNMSAVFFDDLGLPEPDVFIGVGSGTQGYQTGACLVEVEKFLIGAAPDVVVVVGDTNAGVSGALAACKLGITVAHYEAGSRSHDWSMPEELYRRLLDSIYRFCFAPTPLCLRRLVSEGREQDSYLVGDTLIETALEVADRPTNVDALLNKHTVKSDSFGLLTIHRADNTDNLLRLSEILKALNHLDYPILFPIHPRTRKTILDNQLSQYVNNLTLIDPVPYVDFLALIRSARFVVTDSGGVQQESAIFKKPAVTIRDNTEWVETLGNGGNILVRAEKEKIKEQINRIISSFDVSILKNPFEIGAARKSLRILVEAKDTGTLGYRRSNFFDTSYD